MKIIALLEAQNPTWTKVRAEALKVQSALIDNPYANIEIKTELLPKRLTVFFKLKYKSQLVTISLRNYQNTLYIKFDHDNEFMDERLYDPEELPSFAAEAVQILVNDNGELLKLQKENLLNSFKAFLARDDIEFHEADDVDVSKYLANLSDNGLDEVLNHAGGSWLRSMCGSFLESEISKARENK